MVHVLEREHPRGSGDAATPLDSPAAPRTVRLGDLPISVVDRAEAARRIVATALAHRGSGRPPSLQTSANGQVIAMCAADPEIRRLFVAADEIHADGMPLVFASYLKTTTPLPERVATTDLVHDVLELSAAHGLRSFLLGSTPEVNARAVANLRRLYPDAPEIDGHHGYFSAEEEDGIVDLVNAFAPDVLWLGLGVPKEQAFALRNLDRLTGVGVIKTSGGLFDFLSGDRRRAPVWLQRIGLEWSWRAILEPRRLGRRYLETNWAALRLLLTRSG